MNEFGRVEIDFDTLQEWVTPGRAYQITQGLPPDAKLVDCVLAPDRIIMTFSHESFTDPKLRDDTGIQEQLDKLPRHLFHGDAPLKPNMVLIGRRVIDTDENYQVQIRELTPHDGDIILVQYPGRYSQDVEENLSQELERWKTKNQVNVHFLIKSDYLKVQKLS